MNSPMRCLIVGVSVVLLISGCATSSAAGSHEGDLRIEQLPDAGFAVEDRGAVSIAYQMSLRNPMAEAITLRKVEMRTAGRSPYTLRNEPVIVNETIEPGKEALVTFTMWSYSRERSTTRRMVWVSGTLYFDSAKGSFTKVFTRSFREP